MADPYEMATKDVAKKFKVPDCLPSYEELEAALAQSLLEGENNDGATMRQKFRYGKIRSRFSQAEEDVTALMLASAKYTPEHVVALLDHGADLARTDVFEWTALHHAAAHARDDIVQLLLAHGAHAGAEDDEGETPLIVAMRCESSEAELTSTVNHLLATQKADVDHKNDYGRTALMLACYKGHHEVTKALLLAGADLDAVDDGGETARSLVTRFSGEPEQFERVFEVREVLVLWRLAVGRTVAGWSQRSASQMVHAVVHPCTVSMWPHSADSDSLILTKTARRLLLASAVVRVGAAARLPAPPSPPSLR